MAEFPIVETVVIPNATPTSDGLMAAEDKSILDNLSAGGGVDISEEGIVVRPASRLLNFVGELIEALPNGDVVVSTPTPVQVGADPSGTAATLVSAITPASIGAAPVAHTHAQADVASLVADLAAKAPLAHTHVIADTTGLQSALDGKSPLVHIHSIAETSGLQAALDSKSSIGHVHPQSDVINLVSDLAGKAPVSHAHTISGVTGLQAALDGKAALAHTHAQSDITNLVSDLASKVRELLDYASKATPAAGDKLLLKDQAGGLKTVDWAQLPAGSGGPSPTTTAIVAATATGRFSAPNADVVYCENTGAVTIDLLDFATRTAQIFVITGGGSVQFFGGTGRTIRGGGFNAASGTVLAPATISFAQYATTIWGIVAR